MRTPTIFDEWITYPSIFSKSYPMTKSVKYQPTLPMSNPLTKNVKSKNSLPTSFQPFFCGPEKIKKISVVKSLTLVMGVKNGDKFSLKTGFISTNTQTPYNGFKLSLELKNDSVSIVVKQGRKKPITIKGWSVSSIVSSMVIKNPLINESIVKTLLSNGSLKVKFNVSEIKNHGTFWKV